MTSMPTFADLTCRAAIPEDVPFLLKLREATMSTYLIQSGVDLSEEEHFARVMYKFECAEIVLQGEQPVGLLKLQRGEDRWEIIQLQLCPSVQGKGIGTQLIVSVIREANTAKASLTLAVLRGNPARRLYESLGFAITGSDENEYFMSLVT